MIRIESYTVEQIRELVREIGREIQRGEDHIGRVKMSLRRLSTRQLELVEILELEKERRK